MSMQSFPVSFVAEQMEDISPASSTKHIYHILKGVQLTITDQ